MTAPLHLKDFRISLDSGAHSWYVQIAMGGQATIQKRANVEHTYAESPEFKKYLDGYIQFCLEHGHKYDFYVTLDIIGDPKRSWDITEYIESFGLNPMPVYHFGEDPSWFKKMIDKYGYIGIGGLGQDVTKEKYIPFADRTFKYICNNKGTPCVATHGFAMASPHLVKRYPWYSCDASTWTALSRNGTVYIPKPLMRKGHVYNFNYLVPPLSLPVTARRTSHTNHMDHKGNLYNEVLEKYFGMYGFDFESVKAHYNTRDILNIKFFKNMELAAKELYTEKFQYEQGANILLAGTPSGASTNLNLFIDLLDQLKEPETNWLGSYYYQRHNNNLLAIKEKCTAEEDLYTLKKKIKPRGKKKIERRHLKMRNFPTPTLNLTTAENNSVVKWEKGILINKTELPTIHIDLIKENSAKTMTALWDEGVVYDITETILFDAAMKEFKQTFFPGSKKVSLLVDGVEYK